MGPVERMIADPELAVLGFAVVWMISIVVRVWNRVSLSNRHSNHRS